MESAAIIFGLLGTVAWIVSGFVVAGDHRIWAGVVAIVFYVLAGGCTYQQHVWNQQSKAAQNVAPAATTPTTPIPGDLIDFSNVIPGRPTGVGQKLLVRIRIKNHANVPLKHFGAASAFIMGVPGTEKRLSERLDELLRTAAVAGPAQVIPGGGAIVLTLEGDKPLTASELAEINLGTKRLFVLGVLVYKDSAGHDRTSSTCYAYNPDIGEFFAFDDSLNTVGESRDWSSLQVNKTPKLELVDMAVDRFERGKDIEYHVDLKNLGATVARITQAGEVFGFAKKGEFTQATARSFLASREMSTVDDLIAPFMIYRQSHTRTQVTAEEIGFVNNGTACFFLIGRVEYIDQADGRHWIDYCLIFDGKTIKKAPFMNDSDTNGYGDEN